MKAALIIPPLEDFYFTAHRFALLGPLKTAEIIKNLSGINTEIINLPLMEKKQIPLPRSLNYLKKYIIAGESGSCSFFSIFKRYGPPADKCCEIINKINPDAVFFSLFAYCYAEPAIELAVELKKRMPEIPLIAGGAGVSVNPDFFYPYFDAVLPGEGEIALKNFFESIKCNLSHAKQVSFSNKSNTEHSISPISLSVSSLCMKTEVFSTSDVLQHTKEGGFGLSVNTAMTDRSSVNISAILSRGCTKKCRFCSNFITHGREFRKVSVESVKNELKNKTDLFSPHSGKKFFINFEDDNLLIDKDYFFDVIDVFTDFFLRFTSIDKILFSAENGLDYNLLTEEICNDLIKRNFRQFNFTLGSVSKYVLGEEKRSGSSEHLAGLLQYLDKKSVPAVTYFIAGLKNDSPEKVIDSLIFIAENPGISGISMFYSVPGLPDFSDTDYFKKIPPGLLRGSSAYPWNNSLTTEELITAFRISRTVNLFKKNKISEIEKALINKISSEKKLYTLVKKDKKLTVVRASGTNIKMENLFFDKFCI